MNEDTVFRWLNEGEQMEDSIDLMNAIATEGLKVAVCLKSILNNDSTDDFIKRRAITGLYTILEQYGLPNPGFILVFSEVIENIMKNIVCESLREYGIHEFIVQALDYEELHALILKQLTIASKNKETFFFPLLVISNVNEESLVSIIVHTITPYLMPTIIDNLDISNNFIVDSFTDAIPHLKDSRVYQQYFVALIERIYNLMKESVDIKSVVTCFKIISVCIDNIKPGQLFSIIEYIEKIIPIGLSTLSKEPTEWNEEYLYIKKSFFKETEDILSAFQALESYGKLVVGLWLKEDNIPYYLKSNNWKYKLIGLMTLFKTSDCLKKQDEIDTVFELLLPILKDIMNQHPQVRKVLYFLITNYCEDLPPIFKEKYHQVLVPCLLEFIKDPIKLLNEYAFDAIVAFFESIPNSIAEEYIPIFIPLIIDKLQDDNFQFKAKVINILASIMSIGEQSAIPYFTKCIPILLQLLKTTSDVSLQINIIGALSMSAAFAKDNSDLYWDELVDFLIKLEKEKFSLTDKRASAVNLAWNRLIIANSEKIKPLVEYFLPRVLESGLNIHDIPDYDLDLGREYENEEESMEKLTESLNKQFNCKLNCMELVSAMLEAIPEVMEPHFVALTNCTLGDFEYNTEKIDLLDLELSIYLIKAKQTLNYEESTIIPVFRMFFDKFIKKSIDTNEKMNLFAKFISTIKIYYYLSPGQFKILLDFLLLKLTDGNEIALFNNEDIAEIYTNAITEILVHLIEVYKERIIENIYPFWWYYEKYFYLDESDDAYCIISDLITHCSPECFPIVKQATPLLIERLYHKSPGARRSICFLTGEIARYYPEFFNNYLDKAIPTIISIITDENSRIDSSNSTATDNAVFSLGKIIEFCYEYIDIRLCLNTYLKGLPVAYDEYENVYKQVITFIQSKYLQNYFITSKEDVSHILESMNFMFEKIDVREDVMSISDFNIMLQETYPQFNTIIDL